MDQEPATPPSSGGSGKSGIFQNVNTVIAGLTGLVVAVGGLAAATKGVMWDKEPQKEEQQALAAAPSAEPAPAPKKEEAAARPTRYEGDLYADGAFEGGTVQLEQDGDKWVLEESGNKYEYDEIASRDKSLIVAYSADYGSTLRWPAKGGVVEESDKDRRDVWKTYAKVEVAAPN